MPVTNARAIASLRPGAQWALSGDDLSTLQWLDTVQTAPTADQITAEALRLSSVPAPQSVFSQDLMAQFTAADAAAIQAAVAGNVPFWLLWSAMQAQKDPMVVTNARFQAGWAALIQVLGQARMAQIATALNVTIAQ